MATPISTVSTSVRLPVPTSRAIRATAVADSTSQSQEILKLLRLGLKARMKQATRALDETTP
jgi:hypothetical protein